MPGQLATCFVLGALAALSLSCASLPNRTESVGLKEFSQRASTHRSQSVRICEGKLRK